MESGVTDFSPCVQLVCQVSVQVLSCARKYRRNRYWALPTAPPRPALPEGWTWSDDEEYQPRRPIRSRLASGAIDVLSYTIDLFNPAGIGLQLPGGQRRLQRISHFRPRHTQRGKSSDASPYVVLRPRGPVLRVLFALTEPNGLPRRLEVHVALGGMSPRDQDLLRQHTNYDSESDTPDASLPQTWRITIFRQGEGRGVAKRREDRAQLARERPARIHAICQDEETLLRYQCGDRYGPCLLRVDDDTTANNIAVQLLAYLLQEEMVCWEDIEPWLQQYDQRPIAAGTRYRCMMELALPFEPNALRPLALLPAEPEEYSIPQAAKVLGITERQLRYKIEHEEIPGVEKLGRRMRILPAGLEHLRRPVRDQARRQQDKTRRTMFTEKTRAYGMKPDAIRQMIHRGPRTLEGTPDWDALEAQLTCKATKQRHGKEEATVPSYDAL